MNGGIVSIDRLPVERAALSEGSRDFDARQGTCPARRVLPGPESSCFGSIHWLVWASEILGAQGRGRSESRTNFLGGPPFCGVTRISPPFDRWAQNPPTTSSLMAQPSTGSAPGNAARAAG
jgi:hypothetical protein